MRPARLKLRTLIALVALVKFAVSVMVYRQRVRSYRAEAARQEQSASYARLRAEHWSNLVRGAHVGHITAIYKGGRGGPPRIRDLELWADYWVSRATYHERRRDDFLRCAAHPWLSPSPRPEPTQPPWPWSDHGVSLFLD